MKKNIIGVVSALFLILVLSGCSTKSHTDQSQQMDVRQTTPQSDVTPDVVEPEPQPKSEPDALPDSEQQPAAEEPIVQNYHMTKNYFIKPNDENGNKKVVILTFDDGPKDEDMINSLLDTLDKHHAKAIFFVNGYRIKQKPELLKLIYDRKQIIGNHSWDHINLSKESKEKINQQIGDVQDIVKELTGEAPVFFRPPFGTGNDDVHAKVEEEGMLYMTWSNGSLDWADNIKNPPGVIKSVMDQLHPGSDILMHELPWTVEALDELLTKLEAEGYSFVDPRSIELKVRS